MKMSKLIAVPVLLMVVTSCVVPPKKADIDQAVNTAIEAPDSWDTKIQQVESISAEWLASFNDPVLLKLIAEGQTNNIDLKVTAANIEKAWLLAKQSGSTLKPQLDLSLNRTQSGNVAGDPTSRNVEVGLAASWELDVWGRLRAGVKAAEASAQAAEADYVFAQYSLSANIAKTYLQAIEAKQQANIARRNQAILEKTMGITKLKYDNGESTGQDVALNRADVASAREQLIQIEGTERDVLRALEVLLGRYPNAKLQLPDALPDLPGAPPANIPSELLERRPDIISAERKIISAFNATSNAKAARLPRFSLTSSLGGASKSLSDVLNSTNVLWQLAANLVTPLFDGDRLLIDVEIANVEQKQAVLTYAQTTLTAFSEVETNLDQGLVLTQRETALREVFAQSSKASRIAELSYKEGEISLLDVLQIQQQTFAAESNLLSIQRSQLEQRINLYLALGGSW